MHRARRGDAMMMSDRELIERNAELVEQRDVAQRAARIAFKWAGGKHMSESPKGLVHELEDALEVEDYTEFPDWLTGGRDW